MQKTLLLLLFTFLITKSKAQSVYIYANDIPGLVAKIRVYDGGELLTELKKNHWIKINLNSRKNVSLTFKCANYFSNRTVNVNFETNDAVFIRVALGEMGWNVYEQNYPDVPATVWNEYALEKNEQIIKERLASHPKTEWTELKIKEKLNKIADDVEGIYELSFATDNSLRYKLAVLKQEDGYQLIYISGGDPMYWEEGDLKAILEETATPYLYKCNWYMGDKSLNREMFLTFSKGAFKILSSDGSESLYVKLFPVFSGSSQGLTSSGTGFALNTDGYIVTNYHVVENGINISIKGVNGDFSTSLKAIVVAEDKKNDLAVLKIEDPQFSSTKELPYMMNLKVLDVGSGVFALGYPLRSTMGDEVKLTNGIISSKSGFQGDITTYQVSVPVQPGNSGGPMFDNNGNIVGIINAKHTNTDNVSYAIKSLYLYNLLQSMDNPPEIVEDNSISNKPLTEQVKAVNEFVYIIEVSN